MPSDVDKVYVKKHKINDMLNELYTELTSQKPDDPVLFAMKHFEKKLPKTADRPQSGLLGADILPLARSSALLDLANKPPSSPMETDLPPSANVLFSKLFSRLPPTANENIASNEKGLGGGQFALSTFNIIVIDYFLSLNYSVNFNKIVYRI